MHQVVKQIYHLKSYVGILVNPVTLLAHSLLRLQLLPRTSKSNNGKATIKGREVMLKFRNACELVT